MKRRTFIKLVPLGAVSGTLMRWSLSALNTSGDAVRTKTAQTAPVVGTCFPPDMLFEAARVTTNF
jgi:hypothetical protein